MTDKEFITAIHALYTSVEFVVGRKAYSANGDEVVYDLNVLQSYVSSNAYKEQRASAYPSIADQLDKIYHEGIDAWKAQIAAVKQEYPKP